MNDRLTYSSLNQVAVLRKPNRTEEDHIYHSEPCSKSVLNLEKGTIFARTPFGWVLLLLFYSCFMASLCIMWAMLYWVFAQNLDFDIPRWYIQQPGLCIFPSLHNTPIQNINFRENLEEEVDAYTTSISEALAKFGEVPNNLFGKCGPHDEYGYINGNPCFYLKVNRIIRFEVEPFMQSSELPDDAPNDLVQYIKSVQTADMDSRVWLWCVTKPWIKLEYYPNAFVLSKHLQLKRKHVHQPSKESVKAYGIENAKFYNTTDFQRIVAIKALNVTYNQLYNIRCNIWAKNIQRKKDRNRGIVVFTLRIKRKIKAAA